MVGEQDRMVIEKARESDARLLCLVAISAFEDDKKFKPAKVRLEDPPGHDSSETHREWIKEHDYFKCVIGCDIVGGCIVKSHVDYYELFGIFLHKDFIGRGIGRKLLHEVMRFYPEGSYWSLETPDYAHRNHRFYERSGFIEVERSGSDPNLGYGFVRYRNRGCCSITKIPL